MQKLEKRDTCIPTDTSLVRSNCDSVIKHGYCDQIYMWNVIMEIKDMGCDYGD